MGGVGGGAVGMLVVFLKMKYKCMCVFVRLSLSSTTCGKTTPYRHHTIPERLRVKPKFRIYDRRLPSTRAAYLVYAMGLVYIICI